MWESFHIAEKFTGDAMASTIERYNDILENKGDVLCGSDSCHVFSCNICYDIFSRLDEKERGGFQHECPCIAYKGDSDLLLAELKEYLTLNGFI